MIRLTFGRDEVLIDPFGSCVLQWTARGVTRLHLHPDFHREPGSTTHGGVPIVFPQFGEFGDGPIHGSARLSTWRPVHGSDSFQVNESIIETTQGNPCALRHEVRITSGSLHMSLQVLNVGNDIAHFTCGLHTFLVRDPEVTAKIFGLTCAKYLDALDHLQTKVDTEFSLSLDGGIDRVYIGLNRPVSLRQGTERLVESKLSGFEDLVVWSPGCDVVSGMEPPFICVEAAQIHNPIALAPGNAWTGSQTLTVR